MSQAKDDCAGGKMQLSFELLRVGLTGFPNGAVNSPFFDGRVSVDLFLKQFELTSKVNSWIDSTLANLLLLS